MFTLIHCLIFNTEIKFNSCDLRRGVCRSVAVYWRQVHVINMLFCCIWYSHKPSGPKKSDLQRLDFTYIYEMQWWWLNHTPSNQKSLINDTWPLQWSFIARFLLIMQIFNNIVTDGKWWLSVDNVGNWKQPDINQMLDTECSTFMY